MRKTKRRISRGRARSGREPLRQRGHASTGLSTALSARCAVLVRTVVGALGARNAVGDQSASTVFGALSARSAVGLHSVSTVVGALIARSAVGHKYASTVVSVIIARSAVGHQSASTVVSPLSARSAVGLESASTVVCALCARSAVEAQSASTVVCALHARSATSSSHHDSTCQKIKSFSIQADYVLSPQLNTRSPPPPLRPCRQSSRGCYTS
jgi:hypothetical protein